MTALSGRIDILEKESRGMDSKWDSFRQTVKKDVAIPQTTIDSNSARILELEDKLAKYEEKWGSLEILESTIKEAADKKFQSIQNAIKEELITEVSATINETHAEVKQSVDYEILKGKAHDKRHNIIVFGLPDNESADADFTDVRKFFKDRMYLSRLRIETTYRLGSYGNSNSDRPRPLVVTFSSIKDRWAVWNRRRKIKYVKDNPIWLHEDLPKQLRTDNRVLQRIAKVARTNPEKYGEVKVKDFQISVNGQKFSMDALHKLPKELSPNAVYTPRSEEALVFFTRHSPFSNHYACNFDLEGISFSCVEQYLAVQRAYLSRDKILARRAMESKDPADHKMILNQLRNDKLDEWRDKAPGFIMNASRAKYTQNPLLKQLLLSTYPLRIGEASKDTFWGIGLPLESQQVLDTVQWAPEGNLLGRTLMSIRRELMEKVENQIAPEIQQVQSTHIQFAFQRVKLRRLNAVFLIRK